MTTRTKTSLAAGIAALSLAVAAPALVTAATSAQAAVATQDQPRQDQRAPRGRGPEMRGPRRGAMGGPMGGPMGIGPGFRRLDLTDDQKAQLKQIVESHRDEFRAAGEKVRAAREGMRTLMDSDTIDENAIRAKSQEIAAAEAEVMILNARVRQQSMQMLTAEQLAKLKEFRETGPRQGGQRGVRPRRPQAQF